MSDTKLHLEEIAALIERLQNADESALGKLISITQPKLYRYCLHLTCDPVAAEDLMQDVYVKSAAQIHDLREAKALMGWLFRIAKNLLIDSTRTAEHKLKKLSQSDPGPSEEKPSVLGQIVDLTQSSPDDRIELREALMALSKEDRELILLLDLEEYSGAEVAKLLKTTENAIKQRAHRARKKFFNHFKGKEDKNDE